MSSVNAQISDSKIIDIVDVLKVVETNRNPKAIGDSGRAYGILQIHKICVTEVNSKFNTNFSHEDMFNEEKAELVAVLYLKIGVNVFYKKYKRHATEEDLVRGFNGGIYSGYLKDSTRRYYKRYLEYR